MKNLLKTKIRSCFSGRRLPSLIIVIGLALLGSVMNTKSEITGDKIEKSLLRKVDFDLSDSTLRDAILSVRLEIQQSWQQSEGGSGVTPTESRNWKCYFGADIKEAKGNFVKGSTRLEVCRIAAEKGTCLIVINSAGIHLLSPSIILDKEKYKEISARVFVEKNKLENN
jgi:hypothetical protein